MHVVLVADWGVKPFILSNRVMNTTVIIHTTYTSSLSICHSVCHSDRVSECCPYTTHPRQYFMQNCSSSPSPIIRRMADGTISDHCSQSGRWAVWWPYSNEPANSHLWWESVCQHHFKCQNYYCTPYKYVCDGKQDCPFGDDEFKCVDRTCVGLFKCQSSNICLHYHDVEDGVVDCKEGDDEIFKGLSPCPTNCSCLMVAVVIVRWAL